MNLIYIDFHFYIHSQEISQRKSFYYKTQQDDRGQLQQFKWQTTNTHLCSLCCDSSAWAQRHDGNINTRTQTSLHIFCDPNNEIPYINVYFRTVKIIISCDVAAYDTTVFDTFSNCHIPTNQTRKSSQMTFIFVYIYIMIVRRIVFFLNYCFPITFRTDTQSLLFSVRELSALINTRRTFAVLISFPWCVSESNIV